VNFFNPTASTSVFAKVDVTFGRISTASAARPACASPGSSAQGAANGLLPSG
jgi:hypothetical protein